MKKKIGSPTLEADRTYITSPENSIFRRQQDSEYNTLPPSPSQLQSTTNTHFPNKPTLKPLSVSTTPVNQFSNTFSSPKAVYSKTHLNSPTLIQKYNMLSPVSISLKNTISANTNNNYILNSSFASVQKSLLRDSADKSAKRLRPVTTGIKLNVQNLLQKINQFANTANTANNAVFQNTSRSMGEGEATLMFRNKMFKIQRRLNTPLNPLIDPDNPGFFITSTNYEQNVPLHSVERGSLNKTFDFNGVGAKDFESRLNLNFYDVSPKAANSQDSQQNDKTQGSFNIATGRRLEAIREKHVRTPSYVGEQAIRSYYEKYRNLNKHMQHSYKNNSACLGYLNKLEKLKQVPNPAGLVKWKGKDRSIDIK
jgi:hypothetical protein